MDTKLAEVISDQFYNPLREHLNGDQRDDHPAKSFTGRETFLTQEEFDIGRGQ